MASVEPTGIPRYSEAVHTVGAQGHGHRLHPRDPAYASLWRNSMFAVNAPEGLYNQAYPHDPAAEPSQLPLNPRVAGLHGTAWERTAAVGDILAYDHSQNWNLFTHGGWLLNWTIGLSLDWLGSTGGFNNYPFADQTPGATLRGRWLLWQEFFSNDLWFSFDSNGVWVTEEWAGVLAGQHFNRMVMVLRRTWDKGTDELFINGVSKGEVVYTHRLWSSWHYNSRLYIGGFFNGVFGQKGRYYTFNLWDRALCDCEVNLYSRDPFGMFRPAARRCRSRRPPVQLIATPTTYARVSARPSARRIVKAAPTEYQRVSASARATGQRVSATPTTYQRVSARVRIADQEADVQATPLCPSPMNWLADNVLELADVMDDMQEPPGEITSADSVTCEVWDRETNQELTVISPVTLNQVGVTNKWRSSVLTNPANGFSENQRLRLVYLFDGGAGLHGRFVALGLVSSATS